MVPTTIVPVVKRAKKEANPCPACKAAGFPQCHGPHISDETIKAMLPNYSDIIGAPLRVEVIADSSDKWCGNALTFETVERRPRTTPETSSPGGPWSATGGCRTPRA